MEKEPAMNDKYWLDFIALSTAEKLLEASNKIYVGRDCQKTAVFQCIVREALKKVLAADDHERQDCCRTGGVEVKR